VKDRTVEHFLRLGLKLYSTDTHLIAEAQSLGESHFQYVELYVVPGSFEETIHDWRSFSVPYVIHAPHSLHGVNLAREEGQEVNLRHLFETRRFADALSSQIIIVHGGHSGSFQETIRQLHLIKDSRLIIENKPVKGLYEEECIGWSPAELRFAVETGAVAGIALDLVHACCAATSIKRDALELIKEFLVLKPKVFHLSDAIAHHEKDSHLNFGKGGLDLRAMLSVVPDDGWLTIETPRRPTNGLVDYKGDVCILKKMLSARVRKWNAQAK
jgi:sugar phosphate isomerase/epimerase